MLLVVTGALSVCVGVAWAVHPRRPKLPPLDRVREALQQAHGIQARAAVALGIPRSTQQNWLSGERFTEVRRYAEELRARHAPSRGRPWRVDETRDRKVVAQAWKSSGYRLSVAARLLGLPRTSVRHLLHRYGLPNLPAPGRSRDEDERR